MPQDIPIRQLAKTATTNHNIGGSFSSGAGALKDAKAISAKEAIAKTLTIVILVICGTFTRQLPFATLVKIEKVVIAN